MKVEVGNMSTQVFNKVKKTFSVCMSAIILAGSLLGCSSLGLTSSKSDFDISGYIRSFLDSSYKDENDSYISFSNVTSADAENNNTTTVSNAVVRFRTKYNLVTSDDQETKLTELFKAAYALSKYTVNEKTEASYGFDVVVYYTPQTSFSSISDQIQSIISNAYDANVEGGTYIDKIIDLCNNVLTQPTYGNEQNITIDIKEDSSGYLSMNRSMLSTIDESILPL
jgi:hypothetical protein